MVFQRNCGMRGAHRHRQLLRCAVQCGGHRHLKGRPGPPRALPRPGGEGLRLLRLLHRPGTLHTERHHRPHRVPPPLVGQSPKGQSPRGQSLKRDKAGHTDEVSLQSLNPQCSQRALSLLRVDPGMLAQCPFCRLAPDAPTRGLLLVEYILERAEGLPGALGLWRHSGRKATR